MEPACRDGTHLTLSRLVYWWTAPARGDLVAIRAPDSSKRLELKRIIGLPNETVSYGNGTFQINGVPLDEPYARMPVPVPGDEERQVVRLGAEDYFVAGDHRLYSRDSRQYGPVRRSAILGKVLLDSPPGKSVGVTRATSRVVTLKTTPNTR